MTMKAVVPKAMASFYEAQAQKRKITLRVDEFKRGKTLQILENQVLKKYPTKTKVLNLK